MCVFEPGTQVVRKSTRRLIGRVERMEDTPPGEPRRAVVAGVSYPASDLAPLVGPWDKGDK
jgi:hypothetical protein